MTNGYFDTGVHYTALSRDTLARSAAVNAIAAAVASAFDKLPTEAKIKSNTVALVGTFGGTAAALTCSLYASTLTSYADGMLIVGRASAAATGATTINLNSIGVKSVKRMDGSAVQAGDWATSDLIELRYNATHDYFVVQSAAASATASAASATAAAASATAAASSASSAATSASAAATSVIAAAASATAAAAAVSGVKVSSNDTTPSHLEDKILGSNGIALTTQNDGANETRTVAIDSTASPQVTGLNVGHASDTTITRASAGDIAIEGNTVYRAGGTDVAVADGGTGASTAAGAATNLGLGTGDSPQFTGVNIGHASDTTITRSGAGTIAVEGVDVLTTGTGAKLAGGQTLTGGFASTAYDAGTKSSGTFTPDPANGNFQRYINGGAHTLAPPSATGDYTITIQVTNNGSAGAITVSGFTKTRGDTLTTTNGDDFLLTLKKINGFTLLTKVALQ